MTRPGGLRVTSSPRYDVYGDLLRQRMRTRFGTSRLRHRSLCGLAMSRDGRFLAAGASNGEVVIWKATTGKRLFSGTGPTAVCAVAFVPGATMLAAGGEDGTVQIWDMREAAATRVLNPHPGPVTGLYFYPEGARLVTAGGREVRIWEGDTEDPSETLTGPDAQITNLAVCEDVIAVAAGSEIWIWRRGETDVPTTVPMGAAVVAIGWDRGRLLAVMEGGELVALSSEDPLSGVQKLRSFGVRPTAMAVDYGRIAVGDREGQVWLLTVSGTGLTERTRIVAHDGPVDFLLWSPEARVVGSLSSGQHSPRLWMGDSGARIRKGDCHEGACLSLDGSEDGTVLVTAGEDGRLILWDETGRPRATAVVKDPDRSEPSSWLAVGLVYRLHPGCVAVSDDGMTVVAGVTNQVVVWRRGLGKDHEVLHVFDEAVEWVRLHRSGQVAAGAGTVVWMNAGLEERVEEVAVDAVFVGATLMVACNGCEVRRWSTDDGRYLDTVSSEVLFGDGPVALSPDGERGVLMTDETLIVWDTDDGTILHRLAAAETATCLAWSPDNRYVAYGAEDGGVRIVDLSTEETAASLFGHGGAVRVIRWKTSGALFTGSDDCTAVRWDVPS